MIHAQVTVSPISGQFAIPNRTRKTFEVHGSDRVECEQKALDMYGDYSRVTGFSMFDKIKKTRIES
jgi:hypothetical protein